MHSFHDLTPQDLASPEKSRWGKRGNYFLVLAIQDLTDPKEPSHE